MSTFFQSFDQQRAAINSTDLVTCRVVVPFAHKLKSATLYTHTVVTTGTVTTTLKQADDGDARAGVTVGVALDNTTLAAHGNVSKKTEFVLKAADMGVAPAGRLYFIVASGTDAADRVDDPLLVIEVENV